MKMNTLWALLVVIIIVLLGWWYWASNSGTQTPTDTATTTPVTINAPDQTLTLAGGKATLAYSSADFGLATTSAQVTVTSYIPSCDPDFDYCFYYKGNAYAGTNFDSAGVRVKTRTDLKTQNQCLTTPPSGYTNMTPTIATSTDYATATFTPVGDAGAGHYASGSLYRLEYSGSCYEFETRIGATQYANYPAGTIQEFTDADQATVSSMLMGIVSSLTTASSSKPF